MKVAITSVIWLERCESSYMIANFCEHFLKLFDVFEVYIFSRNQVTYNDTSRRISYFLIFLEFFMPISKYGQNDGHDRSYLGVESCKNLCISLMKQVLFYLKMIFSKNHEQTTRHLQFKFDLLLIESAEICLFHETWMETFLHPTIWLFVHSMWYNIFF